MLRFAAVTLGAFLFLVTVVSIDIRTDVHEQWKQLLIEVSAREVVNGIVLPHASTASHSDMRLAYASTALRRQPLFSLQGSDIGEIRLQIHALRQQVAVYSQRNDVSFETLYPFDVLEDLVLLEERRRMYLSDPSNWRLQEYLVQLRRVSKRYDEAFAAAFDFAQRMTDSGYGFWTFAGRIDKESFIASLDAHRSRSRLAREAVRQLERCLSGVVSECSSSQIMLPSAQAKQIVLTASDRARATRIAEVYRKVMRAGLPSASEGPLVLLSTSVCAPEGKKAIFADTSGTQSLLAYVADVPLIKAEDRGYEGRVLELLREYQKQGLPYFVRTPTAHYICPEALQDVARIDAVRSVYASGIVPTDRTERGWQTEYAAALALQGLRDSITKEGAMEVGKQHEVEALLALWDDRSSGLEHGLRTVERWWYHALQFQALGRPIVLTQEQMIPLHAGIATLFLFGNASIPGTPISPFVEMKELFGGRIIYFSEANISYNTLLRIMQIHTDFHNPVSGTSAL